MNLHGANGGGGHGPDGIFMEDKPSAAWLRALELGARQRRN